MSPASSSLLSMLTPLSRAAPSWEKLGEPMVLHLGGVPGGPVNRTLEITADMLRAAAETFSAEVAVEPTYEPGPFTCWGWIERAEMRGDALWGFVRWTAQRPLHGVAAVLRFPTHDPQTGAPGPCRLEGAIVRPAVPAMPSVTA